jgi:NADH:ubiquinone oxidoreductase subunit 6 (subunit J)
MFLITKANLYYLLTYFIEPNFFFVYLWLSLCFICFLFVFLSIHIITSSLFFIMLYLLLIPFGFFFELEFLVLLLLIVYVGAIAIFFVFIIMSLDLKGVFFFPILNYIFYLYFFIFCFVLLTPMFYFLPDFFYVSQEPLSLLLLDLHLPESLGYCLFYENIFAIILLMILFFFIMVSIPLIFNRKFNINIINLNYYF